MPVPTIQIGDLVEYQNERWLVGQRNTGVRTVTLRKLDGTSTEVANDDPTARVVANLPTAWPFITVARKNAPIDQVTITRGGRTSALTPMVAWVPADPLHNGGVLYFHPRLNLRHGEVLVARHANGAMTRINVTPSYGTVQRKLAIDVLKRDPPPPETRYDRLLQDDDDDF